MGRGKKEGKEGKRLRLRWTRANVSGLAFPGRFCRRSRDVPSNALASMVTSFSSPASLGGSTTATASLPVHSAESNDPHMSVMLAAGRDSVLIVLESFPTLPCLVVRGKFAHKWGWSWRPDALGGDPIKIIILTNTHSSDCFCFSLVFFSLCLGTYIYLYKIKRTSYN